MNRWFIVPCLALVFLTTGCATSGKSTLLGMGVGAGVGGTVGAMAKAGSNSKAREKNIILGVALGSLVGALLGNTGHKYVQSKEDNAFKNGQEAGLVFAPQYPTATGHPKLKAAKVKVRFVDDKTKGKTKVPAHFEYDILEEAQWE